MRVKHTVLMQLARDTEMRRLFYSDDSQLSQQVIDGFEKHAQGHIAIAAAATESLSFGDVAAVKGLYLEVDQNAKVRINGSATDIVLAKPPSASADAAKLFLEADVTAVEIENPTTEPLTGIYIVWGDPTP